MVADTKYCPACSTMLPKTEFHKNSTRKDGVQSRCKVCFKGSQKKYRSENVDKVVAYSKKYHEENRDYFSSWTRLNRSKRNQQQTERENRKRNATPSWLTEAQRKLMEDTYWLAKDLTAVSGAIYHVDHIVPLRGESVCGLHVPWNLQVLPADLNLSKSNKITSP